MLNKTFTGIKLIPGRSGYRKNSVLRALSGFEFQTANYYDASRKETYSFLIEDGKTWENTIVGTDSCPTALKFKRLDGSPIAEAVIDEHTMPGTHHIFFHQKNMEQGSYEYLGWNSGGKLQDGWMLLPLNRGSAAE